MSKRFYRSTHGNFGVFAALMALPLVLAVGASVDLARHHAAQSHLQTLADHASLAMAISHEQDPAQLRRIGEASISANLARGLLGAVILDDLAVDALQVELDLSGSVPTTFMSLAGFHTMKVKASALAKREASGAVEIALVLDNTYSMIGPGKSGEKIASLKRSASGLVEKLLANAGSGVRIGLVPYADYVNVGTQYKAASWLKIETQDPPKCRTDLTYKVCNKRSPTYACTVKRDGVPQAGTCGGECLSETEERYNPPRQVCDRYVEKVWHGCVGSRIGSQNRLNDLNPGITYPGLIDDIVKCPNPLLTLTDDKRKLLTAINAMVVEKPYYQPLTYIPAGLIWGQNVLSPSQPLNEAAAYDPKNRKPRKIMILMTDGANTMTFYSGDGHHGSIRGGDNDEKDISSSDLVVRHREQKETDASSLAICQYAKNQKIEIYTVSFMVDTAEGRALMRDCATSDKHYFDANDSAKLAAAFSGIADSINRVRLAR